MNKETYTIYISTPQGELECEATFAVELQWDPAEPDVGIMSGGWSCAATLLSWPHGKAHRSRADLIAILGEGAVAGIEDAVAAHFAEEAAETRYYDDDRGDYLRDLRDDY